MDTVFTRSSGSAIPVWIATVKAPNFAQLTKSATADVCIIGAGIAGLSTAYLLAKEGKSVVVLEDGRVGSGETGRTTAHITYALDDRYFELEKLHGVHGAQLAAESHKAAIEKIAEIVAAEKIDCDFDRLPGYLFVPPRQSTDVLERELAAVRRIGLSDVEIIGRAPVKSFNTGPALKFPNQAQFHPMKYLHGLARAITALGGKIFEHTHVEEVQGSAGGRPATVRTKRGVVSAKAVVVATNTPINNWVRIHTKQAAYRTYVIGVRVPKGSVPKALYWDVPRKETAGSNAYHYVRLQEMKTHDLLIVGGEDHKTGQSGTFEHRYRQLEVWTRNRFPFAGEVVFEWSGQVIEPMDGLAHIGQYPKDQRDIYIATGDSGNGMTHGTIAGMLLTDLIMGRDNRWAKLYDPSRVTLRAMAEFASENINVMARYAEYITPGEEDSVRDLLPGHGAVIRNGMKKIAAYRDENGELYKCSAVCTHLNCIVNWNPAEKTWDCPCHGSRFTPRGEVINGPAVAPLEQLGMPKHEPKIAAREPGEEATANHRSARAAHAAPKRKR